MFTCLSSLFVSFFFIHLSFRSFSQSLLMICSLSLGLAIVVNVKNSEAEQSRNHLASM